MGISIAINSVTFDGTSRDKVILPASVQFSRPQLGSRGTASFTMRVLDGSGYEPLIGQDVGVYDVNEGVATKMFGGSIEQIVKTRLGLTDGYNYDVSLTGNERKCDKHVIKGRCYRSMTAGAIVADILSVDLVGEAITVGTVSDGASVTKIIFDGVTVSQAFDQLAALSGYLWYVDPDSHLYFIARDSVAAPFDFTGADVVQAAGFTITTNRSDFRGSQVMRLSFAAFADSVQSFTGDGTSRSFTLDKPVKNLVSIKLNDADVDYGNRDNEAGKDWYWAPGEQDITQEPTGTPLTADQTLTVRYQALGGDLFSVEDWDTIIARNAVEGTTGFYAVLTERTDIVDGNVGLATANALLSAYKVLPKIIECETRRFGLQPGMLLHVNTAKPAVVEDMIIDSADGYYVPTEDHFRVKLRLVGGSAAASFDAPTSGSGKAATWLQWWEELGGGGSGGGGIAGSAVGPQAANCCARFDLAAGGNLDVDKETPFAISEISGTAGAWDAIAKNIPTGADVIIELRDPSGTVLTEITIPDGTGTLQRGIIAPGTNVTAHAAVGYCRVKQIGSSNAGGDVSIKIYASGTTGVQTLRIPDASILTPAVEHIAYYHQFLVVGGNSPYTWAVKAGSSLPPGFALTPFGVLWNADPSASVATFTIQVTDSKGITGEKQFTLRVQAATPANQFAITTPGTLPAATEHQAYWMQFAASAGTPPYTWSAQSSLPTNWTLLSDGQFLAADPVTGVGGGVGTWAFTIAVTDSAGISVSKRFTIAVNPVGSVAPLAITTATPLPNATQYQPWYLQFEATGGRVDQPYAWQFHAGSSAPGGYSGSNGGFTIGGALYSFAPTPGDYSFSIDVIDADGSTVTKAFTLHVDTAPALAIATATALPDGHAGEAYYFQFEATGGKPGYTWALASGSLPTGFALNPNGQQGVLNCFTPAAGDYSFSLSVTDQLSDTTTKAFTLHVA